METEPGEKLRPRACSPSDARSPGRPSRPFERLPGTLSAFPVAGSRGALSSGGPGSDAFARGTDGVPPPDSIGLRLDRDGFARTRDGFARSPAARSGVPFPAVPNHRVADDEEFPRRGDGDDLRGFPCGLEPVRELRENRIATGRREGRLERDVAHRLPAAADDRLPSEAPLSRAKGARPAREAIFPRPIRPISGISPIGAEVATGPIPGALLRITAVLRRFGSDTMNVRIRSSISET